MQNLIHNTDEPIYETDPQTKRTGLRFQGGGGMDSEFGFSRCKLLYTTWINKKALLHSTGNYTQPAASLYGECARTYHMQRITIALLHRGNSHPVNLPYFSKLKNKCISLALSPNPNEHCFSICLLWMTSSTGHEKNNHQHISYHLLNNCLL